MSRITPQRLLKTGDFLWNTRDNVKCIIHWLITKTGQRLFESRVADIDQLIVYNAHSENQILSIHDVQIISRRKV